MRFDSDSESIKRGVFAIAATPLVGNRRATAIGNMHRGSIYYPAISEVSLDDRSINTSAST